MVLVPDPTSVQKSPTAQQAPVAGQMVLGAQQFPWPVQARFGGQQSVFDGSPPEVVTLMHGSPFAPLISPTPASAGPWQQWGAVPLLHSFVTSGGGTMQQTPAQS